MIGEEDFVEKMGGGLKSGLTDYPEYNLHESLPLLWWGTSWDVLLGVELFNFSLIIAIPAWLGERHPTVDAPTIVFGLSLLPTCHYILIGMLGAMAILTSPIICSNPCSLVYLGQLYRSVRTCSPS